MGGKKNKALKTVSKILISLLLISLLGYLGYIGYVSIKSKPYKVRVTNVTDSAFTVSWITDKPMIGVVYYDENNDFLPGPLVSMGKKVAVDDRDMSKAQTECIEKFTERASKTKDENFVVDVSGFNCEDVKITKYGKYYTHHVTVENLEPDKTYYFRIGNGRTTYNKNNGVYTENELSGIDLFLAKTRNVFTEVGTPNPAYGVTYNLYYDKEKNLVKNISFDSLMFLLAKKDGVVLGQFSGVANSDGGWSIDLGNIRDLEGNIIERKDGIELEFIPQTENFLPANRKVVSLNDVESPLLMVGNNHDTWEEPEKEKQGSVSSERGVLDILKYKSLASSDTRADGDTDEMIVTNKVRDCLDPDGCVCLFDKQGNNYMIRIDVKKGEKCSPKTVCKGKDKWPGKMDIQMGDMCIDPSGCECFTGSTNANKDAECGCECGVEGCVGGNGSEEDYDAFGRLVLNAKDKVTCDYDKGCLCVQYYEGSTPRRAALTKGLTCRETTSGLPAPADYNDEGELILYADEASPCNYDKGCICVQYGDGWTNPKMTPLRKGATCRGSIAPPSGSQKLESNQCYLYTPFSSSGESFIDAAKKYFPNENCKLITLDEGKTCADFRNKLAASSSTLTTTLRKFSHLIFDEPTCGGLLGNYRFDPNNREVECERVGNNIQGNNVSHSFESCEDLRKTGKTDSGEEVLGSIANGTGSLTGISLSPGLKFAQTYVCCYAGDIADLGRWNWLRFTPIAGFYINTIQQLKNIGKGLFTLEPSCSPTNTFLDNSLCEGAVSSSSSLPSNRGGFLKKTFAQGENPNNYFLYFPETGAYNLSLSSKLKTTALSGNGVGGAFFYEERNGVDGYQAAKDLSNPAENEDRLVPQSSVVLSVNKETIAQELSLDKGVNIISLTLLPSTGKESRVLNSDEFLKLVNNAGDNVSAISSFSGGQWANGTVYDFKTGETKGVPFSLSQGIGYLVMAERGTTISVPGYAVKESIPVAFSSGWNLIGIHGHSRAYTAKSLINSISSIKGLKANHVSYWPTSKGMYEGYQLSEGQEYGQDFPISKDLGYFVRISDFKPLTPTCKSINWNPGGQKNGECN